MTALCPLDRYEPHQRLLVEALRLDADASLRLHALLHAPVDWLSLGDSAIAHGVLPLLYARLRDTAPDLVPAADLARLRAQYVANAQRNLLLTARLVRALSALEQRGVRAVPVKGPALAMQAYNSLELRDFADLDLLISRADLEPARQTLAAMGYRPELTEGTAAQRAFVRLDLELPLVDGDAHLDVHWRLLERYLPLRLDLAPWLADSATVDLLGNPVPTLTPERALFHLAINGLRDGWRSLKSIVDVAHLVSNHPALDEAQLWEEARASGARRIVALALALARDVAGLTLSGTLEAELAADAALPQLEREICAALMYSAMDGNVAFALFRRARERWTDRLACRLAPNERDWAVVDLPDRLYGLYYLVRPVRLVAQRGTAALRRLGGPNR